MKTVKKLSITIVLINLTAFCWAQEYIYLSREGIRDVMRVNIGYSNWTLTPKDSNSGHSANGIHLSNEVKIVSALWDKKSAFTVHDAFYFDINLGLLQGDARKPTAGASDKEKTFSMNTNFGYLLLAGYRNKKWGALAGLDFRWQTCTAGGFGTPNLDGDLFNFTRPFVVRGEYCISESVADKRAIGTIWYDSGTNDYSRATYFSFRGEYPIGSQGRWWLLGQYTFMQSIGDDKFYSGSAPFVTNMNQFIIGFRIQNALL
ncbi:MAG: hypothetical protein V4620_12570 [Bacteroidota bacterium]